MDESTLDGEVGKRLNQIVPVPVSIYIVFISNSLVDCVIQYYIVLSFFSLYIYLEFGC